MLQPHTHTPFIYVPECHAALLGLQWDCWSWFSLSLIRASNQAVPLHMLCCSTSGDGLKQSQALQGLRSPLSGFWLWKIQHWFISLQILATHAISAPQNWSHCIFKITCGEKECCSLQCIFVFTETWLMNNCTPYKKTVIGQLKRIFFLY